MNTKIMNKTYICKCRSEFEVVKCNLKQKWNNDKSQCGCKNQQELGGNLSVCVLNLEFG